MIFINIRQKIAATPEMVKSTLLDHAQLHRFFNAKFLLIKSQNSGEVAGGKGAIRQIQMSGLEFKEQIISADDNHISYQIIGNKPVAKHQGDIYFSSAEDEVTPVTAITYCIQCAAPWWLPSFILKFFIEKDIVSALKKLNSHFKEQTI